MRVLPRTRFQAFVPQRLQEDFCKLPFVGVSPTEGSVQDSGVTAASPPVKRTVRVRIPAS